MGIEQLTIVFIIGMAAITAFFMSLLSLSGSIAAFSTGLFISIGFGIDGLIVLGIFFLTSSLLSKFKESQKEFLGELHEKGSKRDWAQVAANGGTAALAGIGYFLSPSPMWIYVLSISLASANADTWASEVGTLSKKLPISIKTFQRVPRGTSGAVSELGTLAAAGGSAVIALTASLIFSLGWKGTLIIFLFGMVGTTLDSLFGAWVQEQYRCDVCRLQTEKTVHCQKPTSRISGFKRIDNDAVNFLSCFSASLMGIIIYIVLP